MKSFIRERVYKNCVVESDNPRVIVPPPPEKMLPPDPLPGDEELPPQPEEEDFDAGGGESALEVERLEAKKIIESARLRAEEIMAQATAEAEARARKVIEEAQAEAEKYKEEFAARVRAEATEQGYAAGFEQGLAEGQKVAEKIRAEARQLLDLATKAYYKEYAQVEDQLIHLAIKIAERILRAQLDVQPSKLVPVIKHLLRLPHERGNWRLHIAKEDAPWLRQVEQELGISMVEDERLVKGDCFLECEEGVYDARLDSQLHVLEEALKEEFRRGELEQAAPSG